MSPKIKDVAATKREQTKKAGSTVFIVVAISSVIVMFSAISVRFLWQKKGYNDRVISAKTEARDGIRDNINNINKLSEQFSELESSASANPKTILHALPPAYDYAALATTMDYLASISGVKLSSGIGDDISATAASSSEVSEPVELPLNLNVTGSYESIKMFIENLENSIRPMHITAVTYSGSSESLDATVTASTYYQPARSLDVIRSQLQ